MPWNVAGRGRLQTPRAAPEFGARSAAVVASTTLPDAELCLLEPRLGSARASELGEHRLRFPHIDAGEAFRKPGEDRRKQGVGRPVASGPLPQTGPARRGTQLEQLGAPVSRRLQRQLD